MTILKKNNNHATQDVKVLKSSEASSEEVDQIHALKVKEAMSSVDKSTIEDLHQKDSTLKKYFNRVGKPIIRENYVGEFFMKNLLLYWKHQETKTGRSSNQKAGALCDPRISM